MSTRQFLPFDFIFVGCRLAFNLFFCELIPFKFRSSAPTSRQNVQRETKKNVRNYPPEGVVVLLV